jgi:hypothetical protein
MVKTFSMGLALSTVVLVLPASAQVMSVRSMNDCVHKVPNGAQIDVQTGVTTLNGAPVAQTCTSGPQFAGGGYYDQYKTPTETVPFDMFAGYFIVPSFPADNSSTGVEFWNYFPGLVAAWPDGPVILQPVLSWEEIDGILGDTHSYAMYSVMNYHTTDQSETEAVPVNPGDTIETFIYQIASNPDAWKVTWYDEETGQNVSLDISKIFRRPGKSSTRLTWLSKPMLRPRRSTTDLFRRATTCLRLDH